MIPIPLKNIFGRLALAWHERAVALKAITFALVGVVNSAIDFGFFSAAYYYFGLSIIVSQLIAWTVAVSGSYVMNSKITFAAESGRKLGARTYFGFVLTQVAGFLANTATVLVAALFIPVWAGKLLAIGASFLVNFALSHFVVFRTRRDQ
ncbi:MAG: GtrA family protein [Pseudolabrys sp.]|jgi:putative flippase GtrA